MKRLHILITVGMLILGFILALSGTARNPADFTGKWYYSADGAPYLFHNGIIISEKHHLTNEQGEIISGAYSFANEKILLFFINADGVEQVQELQFVSRREGDTLCRSSSGEMTAVFYRNKDAAKERKEQ